LFLQEQIKVIIIVFCMHNHNPVQKIGNPTKALCVAQHRHERAAAESQNRRGHPPQSVCLSQVLVVCNAPCFRVWLYRYAGLKFGLVASLRCLTARGRYDCCKYDAIHTQRILGRGTSSGTVFERMYATARSLAEFVCPSEYGLSRSQRLNVGCTIRRKLVEKIGRDMKSTVRGYLKSAKAATEEEGEETSDESDDETSKVRSMPIACIWCI